jgi:hypothetical protein
MLASDLRGFLLFAARYHIKIISATTRQAARNGEGDSHSPPIAGRVVVFQWAM